MSDGFPAESPESPESPPLLLLEQPLPPDTMVLLTNEQSARVNLTQPRDWPSVENFCLTCGKADDRTYKWYAPEVGIERATSENFVRYKCNCANQYRLYRWLCWAGIGLTYQRTDLFDSIELIDSEAVQTVMRYARNGVKHINMGNNMVLWSKETGTGKTFLACMLAKRMLWLGFDVYFCTLNNMLTLYTSSWRSEAEREHFEQRVRTCTVLVIDDIGREHPGRADVVIAMLDELLRFRIANCLPTVITTNLPPNKLTSYGANIVSLLGERCYGVEVIGRDKREDVTRRAQRELAKKLTRPIVVS